MPRCRLGVRTAWQAHWLQHLYVCCQDLEANLKELERDNPGQYSQRLKLMFHKHGVNLRYLGHARCVHLAVLKCTGRSHVIWQPQASHPVQEAPRAAVE